MADSILLDPLRLLGATGAPTLRAYEDAATAIGRLDAAAVLAPIGLRQLLVLRSMVTPFGAARDGIISLLRADGEGDDRLPVYGEALRAGSARARGGFVPSVELLRDLLTISDRESSPSNTALDATTERPATASTDEINLLLRDVRVRTPPVLKAAIAAGALLALRGRGHVALASLATSLVLCVGGATTDAWLTLPVLADDALASGPVGDDAGWSAWLEKAFGGLAREARAGARGLDLARKRLEADRMRVGAAFGRASYSALDLLELLASDLVITVPEAARALGQTPPTAGAATSRLVDLGIAGEITGRARSRAFVYLGLVDALAPSDSGATTTGP